MKLMTSSGQFFSWIRTTLCTAFITSLISNSLFAVEPMTPNDSVTRSESMGRTSCPEGFKLIGTPGIQEAYCISAKKESPATWLDANKACRQKTPKAHLCTASEWVSACVDGAAGPNNMTGHWEWVADLDDDHGQAMGSSGCDSFYSHRLFSTGAHRCCFR